MKKKALSQIAFEFLSIVFAVLLALGLNSYKQNLDLRNEGKLLTKNLLTECQANLDKLNISIEENEGFKSFLDSLVLAEEVRGFHFSFSNELLSSIAWNFTKESKAFQQMDSEFLIRAAEVYENQVYYMNNANQMFEYIGSMILEVDNKTPRTLAKTGQYYLDNLIGASYELRKDYESILKDFNNLSK